MKQPNIEIEKKYIIAIPEESVLSVMEEYTRSEIVQIYLESPAGITHRVRSRERSGNVTYTETKKIRIDKMSSYEDEHEITKEEFLALAEKRDKLTAPIHKIRYTFVYFGQLFEIDVYPEWQRTAILETELKTRETQVKFPEFVKILSDVTGDKRYSNASMSKVFPEEYF
ncbi:MAG: hypothetical protein J6D20_01570 [Clostridia bacterium]|nr:hypothetical protein [Clostridia bacterium]